MRVTMLRNRPSDLTTTCVRGFQLTGVLKIRILTVDLRKFSSRLKQNLAATTVQEPLQLGNADWLLRGAAELSPIELGLGVSLRNA